MPRRARIVCPGLPHHLTQRGNNKQDVFHADCDRKTYLKPLYKFNKDCSCTIHAYCLMSNHIHLLITPQSKAMLAGMLLRLSLTYTQYYNKRYNRTGRLWGSRYYSTVVGDVYYLWAVSRYIERNPVRANIVREPKDYQWSSVYVHGKNVNTCLLQPIWSNGKEKEEYLKYLNASDNEADLKQLRESTVSGKPYGSEEFIDEIYKTHIGTRPMGRVPI